MVLRTLSSTDGRLDEINFDRFEEVELSSPLLLSHNHHQHGPGSFSPFSSGIPTTLPQVFTDGSGASTPQCPVTRIVRSGAIHNRPAMLNRAW